MPRKAWKLKKKMHLCERHFTAEDFLPERADTNKSRKKKRGKLSRKKLRPSTIPSKWHNCPNHLSEEPVKKRSAKSTADARRSVEEQPKIQREELDKFTILEELKTKFQLDDLPYPE